MLIYIFQYQIHPDSIGIDSQFFTQYSRSMLTKQDKKFLQETFVTKDDLVNELKPIKKSLRTMNKKLDLTITYFDKATSSHEPRIKRLEEHAQLPPFLN